MDTKSKYLDQNVTDQFFTIDSAAVKVEGEIGRRIDITLLNNLFKINIDRDFLSSFQRKDEKDANYIGIGKLIDTIVRLAIYTNDEKVISLKKYVTTEIIKSQENDGYIGNMIPENRMIKLWDIHEIGYIIYGLVIDYKYFGEKASYEAAIKSADYLIRNWTFIPPDWEKMTKVAVPVAITGLALTMLNLYSITGQSQYLNFCFEKLQIKNWDPGITIGRRVYVEGHVYAYLAMCLAQLELYRQYPDKQLLKPVIEALNFMTVENGMSITGGVGLVEVWTDDQDGRGDLGESCATAYQIRIFDVMLRLFGNARLGDIIERTIYNALFGAQSPDGRFIRYYTPLEGQRRYHNGDTYCCPNNYRRIISELPSMIYYQTGKGVMINLYTSSSANITLTEGINLILKQETDYPNSGHIVIKVDPSEPISFHLMLRIPSWCKKSFISINGIPFDQTYSSGSYATINRIWKAGDKLILNIPMEWRLVEGRQRQAGRVAVMRGPLLFCLNPEQNKMLADLDGADLGQIVIDLKSIEPEPVKDNSVRPDGIGCRIKAGNSPFAMGNEGNVTLTLTEFADPDGKCSYFRVPDLSEAVDDELLGSWSF